MSVFYSLMNSMKDRLNADGSLPTVKIRKRFHSDLRDPLPMIVICPAEDELKEFNFAGATIAGWIRYNINVVLVTHNPGEYVEDGATFFDLRERIRRALFTVDLAVDSGKVIDVSATFSPAYEWAGLNVGYENTAMVFHYTVRENIN